MSENSIDYDVDNRLEIKKRRMERFLEEEEFVRLDLDLNYNNPSDNDDDLVEDYNAVLEHLKSS